jgi:lipopolysaccharide biosynthesis protein
MVPLLPMGFGYDYIIYDRWGPNHAHAERFIKDDLRMDICLDPDVIAPYGGMFWARTGALKTIVGRGWGYEDFPEEPFPANDGLLPHVLERVLPLLAQHDGYYTAMAAPEFYANAALTTLFSMPNKTRATMPRDILTYINLYRRYLRYCIMLKLPFPKYREKYLDKKNRLRAMFNRIKGLLIS